MARIVFTTLGSLGDAFPMIPVARGLLQRGHRVEFAATPAFDQLFQAEGFPFHPVGPRLGAEEYAAMPEILDPGMNGLTGIRNLVRGVLLPNLPRVYEELLAVCRGADLLVTHVAQLAAPMVAETLSLPWVTLTVFPGNIPSAYTVPQGNPLPALSGALGRLANRYAWANSRFVLRALFDRPLNRIRASAGLNAGRDLFLQSGISQYLTLILCSEHYVPRAPDWPAHYVMTGEAEFDRPMSWNEPPALERFLASGRPPIVFTLGASLAADPQGFFELAQSVLREMGERGLLLVGREANLLPAADENLLALDFAPLSRVLAHSAAIVHHGGFGTTMTALRAGRACVVIPRAFDQTFHGERVAALGCGVTLPWRRLTKARLQEALASVLRDDRYATRAREVGDRLRGERGGEVAAEHIHQLLSSGAEHGR